MPSTTSSSLSRPEPSSTVITPSLPTFSIASAMVLPIDSSEFAEIVPTCAMRLGVLARLGELLQLLDGDDHGLVDTALDVHRVAAGGDGLQALADDRLRQHRRGGRAVASFVRGVGSDFLHHLRAHVLELVLQLDFLRDRHTVLRDGGGAEALLEHRVAAFRAECCLDGIGEDVDALEHALARVVAESDFFSCHCRDPSVTWIRSRP